MVNKVAALLSTVIISKNDLAGIIKTLNSFNYLGYEIPQIILVLSEYAAEDIEMIRKKFAHLTLEVHTLPANGPYVAMNHGLAKVKRGLVDPHTLESKLKHMTKQENLDKALCDV